MGLEIYGVYYTARKVSSIVSYKRCMLIVSNIGFIRVDLGPFYSRRKRIKEFLKMMAIIFMGYSEACMPEAMEMLNKEIEDVLEKDVYRWIDVSSEYSLNKLGTRIKMFIIPYKSIKKVIVKPVEGLVTIKTGFMKKYTYLIDTKIIPSLLKALEKVGLNKVKYEFTYMKRIR